MAPRATRSSTAAKPAAAEPQQLSSPPETPAVDMPLPARGKKQNKRTRDASVKEEKQEEKFLDELPHNLGTLAVPDTPDASDETSAPPKKRARRATKPVQVKDEPEAGNDKNNVVATPDTNDVTSDAQAEDGAPAKKRARRAAKPAQVKVDPDASPESDVPEKPKAKRAKKNKKELLPGQSPYPDYARPTVEECYEVNRILSKEHGTVKAPDVIPLPSVEVAGCGEVPSVLDAMIRTLLSAATTGANSSRAFQGLVKRYGVITEGIGKGSVDWNKVRLSTQQDVFEAIKSGGLANAKSKNIKAILDMVYEENQARKASLKKESEDKTISGPSGSENEPTEAKEAEIAKAESDVLSLDHYHFLETREAKKTMQQYPGIGQKTASCVALFCLRRPSFAVDTHVFRLVQYLGWVPSPEEVQKGEPRVDRNSADDHCETKVPDDLKYSLHQLFIKHGKVCPRCRAATSTNSAAWAEGCPIEHLVKRYGAKKGGTIVDPPKGADKKAAAKLAKAAPKKKAGKKGKKVEESEEDEESELSDVESELNEPSEAESELSDFGSEVE